MFFSGVVLVWTGVCSRLVWLLLLLWLLLLWDKMEEEMDPRSNTSLSAPESESSPDPDPEWWEEEE